MLENDITESIVANGFTQCGLYPFNADAVDYQQLIKKPKLDQNVDSEIDNRAAEQSSQFLDQFEYRLNQRSFKH